MLAIVVTSGRERRLAAFLLAAFLFFTLAGTGFNEPFSALREQIHDIPGIALFRNSRYFSIPAALMLSLMVGLVVNARFTDVRHLNRVLGVTAAAILAVGATGIWSGNLLGNLPPYEIDRRHDQRDGSDSSGTRRLQNAAPANDRAKLVYKRERDAIPARQQSVRGTAPQARFLGVPGARLISAVFHHGLSRIAGARSLSRSQTC